MRTEKSSSSEAVIFTVFALEMRENEEYRKKTGSNVFVLLKKESALERDRCSFHYKLSHDHLQILKPKSKIQLSA